MNNFSKKYKENFKKELKPLIEVLKIIERNLGYEFSTRF